MFNEEMNQYIVRCFSSLKRFIFKFDFQISGKRKTILHKLRTKIVVTVTKNETKTT